MVEMVTDIALVGLLFLCFALIGALILSIYIDIFKGRF